MWVKEIHMVGVKCVCCERYHEIPIETDIGVQLRSSDVQEALVFNQWFFNVKNKEILNPTCPECCKLKNIDVKNVGCELK